MSDRSSIPVDYHDPVFGPAFAGSSFEPDSLELFRATLPDRQLVDFLDIWLAAVEDGRPPKKNVMRPSRFPAHLGYVGIIERKDDPLDVVFRLAGTHVVEALGFEMTGHSLSRAIPRKQGFADRYDMFWRPLFESGMPRYDHARLGTLSMEFVTYHALHLPVADDVGDIRYSLFRFLPG